MNRLISTPDADAAYHFEDIDTAQWAADRWNRWHHRNRARVDISRIDVFRVVLDNGRFLTFSTKDQSCVTL